MQRRGPIRAILALSLLGLVSRADAAVTAYVANALENTASAVDVRTGASLATVVVGCDPRDVVVDPRRPWVYVANSCSDDLDALPGTVSVIDTVSNTVVEDLQVGFGPVALAIDGVGQRLFVACLGEVPFDDEDSSGFLRVIDLATGTAVDTIPLQVVPRDLAVTRNGRHAFVSRVAGYRDGAGDVQLNFSGVLDIDVAAGGPAAVFNGPSSHLAVDSLHERLYVVGQAANELVVIDTASSAMAARASCS